MSNAQKVKNLPAPNHYGKLDSWEKHFSRTQGAFLKKKRETMTGETMRTTKHHVAPNKYKLSSEIGDSKRMHIFL